MAVRNRHPWLLIEGQERRRIYFHANPFSSERQIGLVINVVDVMNEHKLSEEMKAWYHIPTPKASAHSTPNTFPHCYIIQQLESNIHLIGLPFQPTSIASLVFIHIDISPNICCIPFTVLFDSGDIIDISYEKVFRLPLFWHPYPYALMYSFYDVTHVTLLSSTPCPLGFCPSRFFPIHAYSLVLYPISDPSLSPMALGFPLYLSV